jgi:PTS system mannose-specific IID component
MTNGFVRAFLRLFAVQGAWNYERLTGIGMGYAAEPLLEDLRLSDPARHAEATVRSAEYFNSHPYLAGAALGALVRAEYDHVPGAQISRLRTALTSPLGALGDQLFWAGLVPATIAAAGVAVVLDFGIWTVAGIVGAYSFARVATAWWALRTGLRSGMRVGTSLGESWLPPATAPAGLAAGAMVGVLLPLAAGWLLDGQRLTGLAAALLTLAVGLGANWALGPRMTAVRFGLGAIGTAALLAWGLP